MNLQNNFPENSTQKQLFQANLENIATHTKYHFLRVNEDGKIEKMGLFKFIFVNLFRIPGSSNKNVIEYMVIKTLEQGVNKHWITEEMLPLIDQIAVKMGVKKETTTNKKIHEVLNELIKEIYRSFKSKSKTSRSNLKFQKNLTYTKEYQKNHKKIIDHFLNILKLKTNDKSQSFPPEVKKKNLEENRENELNQPHVFDDPLPANKQSAPLIFEEQPSEVIEQRSEQSPLQENESTEQEKIFFSEEESHPPKEEQEFDKEFKKEEQNPSIETSSTPTVFEEQFPLILEEESQQQLLQENECAEQEKEQQLLQENELTEKEKGIFQEDQGSAQSGSDDLSQEFKEEKQARRVLSFDEQSVEINEVVETPIQQSLENPLIDLQKKYAALQAQLNHSLLAINDSLTTELHGISPYAVAELGTAFEKMEKILELSLSLVNEDTSFAQETLHMLLNEVNFAFITCTEWAEDFLSHYEKTAKTIDRQWNEALNTEETAFEKFFRIRETAALIHSLNQTLKILQQVLPSIEDSVFALLMDLKKIKHNDFLDSRTELHYLNPETNIRPDANFEAFTSASAGSKLFPLLQQNLFLFQDRLETINERLPDKLKAVKEQNERQIEEIVTQFKGKASELKKQENVEEKVEALLKDYSQVSYAEDNVTEDKIEAYISLRRKLEAILALPFSKNFSSKIFAFCSKEENRLIQETGYEINFDERALAAALKEGFPKPGLLGHLFSYLNPENWSKTSKEIMHGVLLALQVSEQTIGIFSKIQTAPKKNGVESPVSKEPPKSNAEKATTLEKATYIRTSNSSATQEKNVQSQSTAEKIADAGFASSIFNEISTIFSSFSKQTPPLSEQELTDKKIHLSSEISAFLKQFKSIQKDLKELNQHKEINWLLEQFEDHENGLYHATEKELLEAQKLLENTHLNRSQEKDSLERIQNQRKHSQNFHEIENSLKVIKEKINFLEKKLLNILQSLAPSEQELADKKIFLSSDIDILAQKLLSIQKNVNELGDHKTLRSCEETHKELGQAKESLQNQPISSEERNKIDELKNQLQQGKKFNLIENDLKAIKEKITSLNSQAIKYFKNKSSLNQLQPFIETPSKKINEALFQHVLGSYFGRGTGFEGYDDQAMLSYQCKLLSEKIESMKNDPLCKQESTLDFCQTLDLSERNIPLELFSKLEQHMKSAQEFETADIKNLVNIYQTKINRLIAGDSFFFQGGWMQEKGGSHSIIYEVIMQDNNLYTFRVYNRGDGLEYHSEAIVDGKNQNLPFTEILDISKEMIQSEEFFRALQELKSSPLKAPHWKSSDLFEKILPILGGRHSDHVYSADQALEELSVGHCTYLALTALVSQHLGKNLSSRWLLEVELKTMHDYFFHKKNNLPSSESVRKLMKEGILQLNRNVKSAFKQGLINELELIFIKKITDPIDQALLESETMYQNAVAAKASKFMTYPVDNTFPRHLVKYNDSEYPAIQSHPSPPYVAVDSSAYVYHAKTILNDFKSLQDSVLKARNAGQFLNIKEGIKTFLLKIPLEGADVFWKHIHVEEAKNMLTALSDLSFEYICSIQESNYRDMQRTQRLYTDDFLAQAKLTAIADALARHFKEEFGFELPFINQKEMMDSIDGNNIFSATASPQFADQQRILKSYWEKTRGVETQKFGQLSFFGFEENHPGAEFRGYSHKARKIFENQEDAIEAIKSNHGGEELLFNYPDINFATEWIKKHLEIFNDKYPHLKEKNLFFKSIAILSDKMVSDEKLVIFSRPDILPRQFFELRDICYSTHFILKGAWSIDDPNESLPKFKILFNSFQSNIKMSDRSERPMWELVYRPFNSPPNLSPGFYFDQGTFHYYAGEIEYRDKRQPAIYPLIRLQKAQGGVGDYGPLIGGKIGDLEGYRKRIAPHHRQVISLHPPKVGMATYTDINSNQVLLDMNLADAKQLLALSGDQDLQIQETLSGFLRNTNTQLLMKAPYQKLFQYLMTEQGLLINELLKSPQHAGSFSKKLSEFCKKHIELYQGIEDHKTTNFYLEMNLIFTRFINYTKKTYDQSFPDDFVNPMIDGKPFLKQISENKANDPKDRALAAHLLIKSYIDEEILSAKDIAEIFGALIITKQYPPSESEERWGPAKAREHRDFMRQLRGPIEQALKGSQIDNFLNALVHHLNPNIPPLKWKAEKEFPRFKGTLEIRPTPPFALPPPPFALIDMLEGDLFIRNLEQTHIPDKIRTHPFLVSLMGKEAPILASRIDWDKYEFKDKQGRECRIALEPSFILERKIEGNWYRAHDPLDFFEDRPFKAVYQDSICWTCQAKSETLITDAHTDQLKYRISQNLKASTIHKLDKEGKDSGLELTDIYQTKSYAILERFENLNQTLVWKEQVSGEIKKIEFPLYDLHFDSVKKEGESKAYCHQLPGYYLAEKQHVQALGDITTYLLLQKKEGKDGVKQAVIIPRQRMERIKKHQFNTPTKLMWRDTKGQKYFVHDIDRDTLMLKPRTLAGQFHLAMMYLWERNYVNAMTFLKGVGSQLEKYNNEDLEMLDWIINLDSSNSDYTPQATAIRLYAHYLIFKNSIDFSNQPIVDYVKDLNFVGAYEAYLQIEEQEGLFRLNVDEESLFLKTLSYFSQKERKILPKKIRLRLQEAHSEKLIFASINRADLKEDPLDSKAEYLSLAVFFEKVPEENKNVPSVLRSNLHSHFQNFYEKLHQKQYQEVLPEMITFFLGKKNQVNTPIEELKKEVSLLLWLAKLSRTSPKEKILAGMLGVILENSDAFEIPEMINTSHEDYKKWCKKKNLDPYKHYYLLKKLALDWKPDAKSFTDQPLKRAAKILTNKANLSTVFFEPFVEDLTVPPALQTSSRIEDEAISYFRPLEQFMERSLSLIPPDGKRIEQSKNTMKELQTIFAINIQDKVAKRKFDELKNQLQEFGNHLGNAKNRYEIKSIQALHELKIYLERDIDNLSTLLGELFDTIISLANKPFQDEIKESLRQTKIQGGLEKPLAFSQVLQLFRMRDREKFYVLNPALNASDIDKLIEQTKNFLIHATQRQHNLRLSEQIGKVEALYLNPLAKEELDLLVDDLAEMMLIERQYAISAHPEYLNLENHVQFIIRKDQIENLKKIEFFKKRGNQVQENGAALEAIPGSGKTSVLLTLQALNDADGTKLPIIVMPENLKPSMQLELQKTLGNSFEQLIETMTFDRDRRMDLPTLERIKDRLKDVIKNKKALLITDSSIQSLFLKFIELVINYNDLLLTDEIGVFREILAHFRSSGVVTIDEMDLILDVLKAHHFTLGEPVPVKTEVFDTICDFYLFMGSDAGIQQNMGGHFIPGQNVLDQAYYTKKIQPYVIQAIIDGKIMQKKEERTQEGKIFLKNEQISNFFTSLSTKEKEWVATYLNNIPNREAFTFINTIPSMEIKNILAILKEEVSRLFPLTAKKRLNEHYGVLPAYAKQFRDDDRLAIPYRGSNNPIANAQHGTDVEIINFTIQMHLGKGISQEILKEEIERLKGNIVDEIKSGKITHASQSQGYAQFLSLCRGNKAFNPFHLTDEEISKITSIVNTSIEIQIKLIRLYVLPQLKSYIRQLNTNGHIYAALFNKVRGFSGTLWNAEAYPDIFYEIFPSDTMSKTLNILWESSNQKVLTINFENNSESSLPEKVKKMVQGLYINENNVETGRSFADAAGLFRDIEDNILVAREMLGHQPAEIKGMAYYSADDQLMVLLRGQEQGVPIDQSGLSKEQIVAYWDQRHTTGSDIKLGIKMSAFVSVGQHTFIRDLIQAVWRLRGLEKGQKADFVVAAEDEAIIKAALKQIVGEEIEGSLELKHLLLYTLHNQAMRQGEDNHRSLKQKMQTLLIDKIVAVITDPQVTDENVIDLITKTKSLFVQESSQNPYDLYGKIEGMGLSEEVVQEELTQLINGPILKVFAENPILKARYSIDKIKKELQEIVQKELPKLPGELSKQTSYNTEVQVEMNKEMKIEQKVETKKEVQNRLELYGGEEFFSTPRAVITWNKENIFSKKSFDPTSVKRAKTTDFSITSDDSKEMHPIKVDSIIQLDLSPVLKISAVIDEESLVHPYADVFDSDLLSTFNRMPIYPRTQNTQPIYRPFGRYEDIVSHVILVEDKNSGQLRMVIGDQEDAGQFHRLLGEDARVPFQGQRDVRICLYNLMTGVVQQGSESFDLSTLEKNPQLIKLRTQAKFFGGDIQYMEEELKYLKTWIKEKGASKMFTFFHEIILNNKPTQLKNFHGSNLANLFNNLMI